MQYPKPISELLAIRHKRLEDLERRLKARSAVLAQLKAILPAELAAEVASAGIDRGRLSIGVSNAAWASRLRYMSDGVRSRLAAALCIDIDSVRIRVARPRPP